MKIFDKLFEGGEESIIGGSLEIIRIAKEANKELLKLVNSNGNDINPIKTLERESDRKVFQLQQKITSGAVSPNIIDDMLKLIDLEDSIVDSIYNLARELVRYNLPDQKANDLLKKSMADTIQMVDGALVALEKMSSSSNIEVIRTERGEIEALEQQGDDIKDALLDYVYRDLNDFKSFHHINESAHKADDILDDCEDASDMFLSIMVSVMS